MPEMLFTVRWPDGQTMRCYSPSLVVQEHLSPGALYPVDDFLARSRTALQTASERVQLRYGFPCSRALGQLAEIERRAKAFSADSTSQVEVLSFETASLSNGGSEP
jgi:uncharacterized repeat protein (TIGR04042 family)